ncbi:MAG: MmgE/PrpD family protein [Chloroflexota bacterium]
MARRDASQVFAGMIAGLKYEDLPAGVVEITKSTILDTIGVILASSGIAPEPGEIVRLVVEEGGKEESSIIGHGVKVPCYMAAFANGAMGHALDYDDVAFAGGEVWGHIGIATVPAALAVCERIGKVSGKELLAALAGADEMLYRLGIAAFACPTARSEWFLVPVLGVFGAAAASGKLLGLSEEQLVNAFGIALSQAAGSNEIGLATKGAMRAIYAAFPGKTGVLSSLMAQRGIAATENGLEGKAGLFPVYFHGQHDAGSLAAGLGSRFEILRTGFKPWCACAFTHTYIDATLEMVKKYDIAARDVEQVDACTSEYLQTMVGAPLEEKRRPKTGIAAKHSIPFCLAVAIARRSVNLRDFLPAAITDREVLGLAERVVPQVHTDVGTVRIVTKGGKTYSNKVAHPLGSPEKPMSRAQIEAKFRDCASYASKPVSGEVAGGVIRLVGSLEQVADVRDIIRLVAQP